MHDVAVLACETVDIKMVGISLSKSGHNNDIIIIA